MKNIIAIVLIFLAYSFSPKDIKQEFQFFKNGKRVQKDDFSFIKNDKIEFKIANSDNTIKFRVDSLELTVVPDQQFQSTRRQNKYWRRFCKSKMQATKTFAQEPTIQLDFKSIYNKECTRLLVRVLGISEMGKDGTVTPSRRFTLGKEFSYWNFEAH